MSSKRFAITFSPPACDLVSDHHRPVFNDVHHDWVWLPQWLAQDFRIQSTDACYIQRSPCWHFSLPSHRLPPETDSHGIHRRRACEFLDMDNQHSRLGDADRPPRERGWIFEDSQVSYFVRTALPFHPPFSRACLTQQRRCL